MKLIDLTGQRFGRLVVVERAGSDGGRQVTYRCACDCGVKKVVGRHDLRSGDTRSCGCLKREEASRRNTIDMRGRRFGRLIVVERAGSTKRWTATWECRCDCGKTTVVPGHDLRSDHARSCGCLSPEASRLQNTTHGMTRTPEYVCWQALIGRCERPSNVNFANYGGRGIKVCAEWRHDFAAFFAHVGPKPGPEYSIDRIDVNGNYEPGNVRWATAKEQLANQRPRRRSV